MKTLLIGLGASGGAAAELLLAEGEELVAFDDREQAGMGEKRFPVHSKLAEVDFSGIRCAVVSPGVAPAHPLYQEALRRGVEVIGEVELALRRLAQPAVAITGTNGKTTVTLLVQHLLQHAGIRARALGNLGSLGQPLARYALRPDPEETLVVELSSFQLETVKTPFFAAGVLLNITPDHLDRYPSMQEYASAKHRLLSSLKARAPCFISRQVKSAFPPPAPCCCFDTPENLAALLPPDYRDRSRVDKSNALAAWALVSTLGVSHSFFCEGVKSYKKPAHRIEFVAEINGVAYYDDSKGTNVDAVVAAVEAMPSRVVLIAGGVDKGSGYAPWRTAFGEKVKQIVAIGEAAGKIERELSGYFPLVRADSLEKALLLAAGYAAPGESVLLSPGCSSYDMFRDYQERGSAFKRYVVDLKERRNQE